MFNSLIKTDLKNLYHQESSLTTCQVKLFNKKKFTKAVLDENVKGYI